MRRTLLSGAAAAFLAASLLVQGVSAAGLPLTLMKGGFSEPVYVTNAGDSRLFVVQQDGLIKIIHANGSVTTFLDASDVILHDAERGLFSMAFHPNYARNGLFYVMYTRAGDGASTVAEYHVSSGNPDVADQGSARVVISVAQPYSGHNGGWIGFLGKYLYVTVGDGDSPADELGYAQSKDVLNGKILRIDPRDPDGNGPLTYSIPAGNPFVGKPGRDEIWAYGLRNTWRCSFDPKTSKLWCGDVGQGGYEEVDRVSTTTGGYNFGWNLIEGFHYYTAGHQSGAPCVGNCKTLPIAEYLHSTYGTPYASITGGYVARRPGAQMYGKYVFGDYVTGNVWEISATRTRSTKQPKPVADTDYSISSFGVGADGRIYLVDRSGSIYLLNQS
ncbi:MAG TPA: PQQ-dependent sugar dehydrogenase [Candidatus Limnocylindrales bacterium]|jgi:glucose/arabinose dehydrogenase